MRGTEVAWHALPAAEAVQRAASDPRRGLSRAEVARRLAEIGPNALAGEAPHSHLRTFLRQFASPLVLLLALAAAVSFAAGEESDAAVIGAVLLVNSALGAFQEGRAARAMAALRRLAAPRARVLRDGEEETVDAREVVPGDVLVLAAGDAVAADARVLSAAGLLVSEAALTGEPFPVPKAPEPVAEGAALADRASLVHAGTHVASGRGAAVAVATGPRTELGRVAALAGAAAPPATPLQVRVAALGRGLALASLAVFAVVLAAGLIRGVPARQMLLVAVSQLVSTVPEGLPVALTVALAAGMQRMAARRAVVRRLGAVETLGAITTICADKTGTLTRGELAAVAVALPGGRDLAAGEGDAAGAVHDAAGRAAAVADDPALAALVRAICLCNDAAVEPPAAAGGPRRVSGDPTEVALLDLAARAGADPAALRRASPRVDEVPFDGATRWMATVHRGDGPRLVAKGAPEALLPLCGAEGGAGGPGGRRALDEAGRRRWAERAEALAARALRVMAVAEGDGALGEGGLADLRGRLVLLGLVGEADPPRPSAREAVLACRAAGIRAVMVTGDHAGTGLAIARQVGIAGEGDRAALGSDVAAGAAGAVDAAVLARVAPAEKLAVVEALQARGEVVAMTGDGVNDAPALARADVGVALGQGGTEVAKAAAAMVLADDRLETLVEAVAEGRLVDANIRRILVLLLSTGAAEVAVLVGALASGLPLPFLAPQILWNNVVTEGTITVNLALEPRDGRELSRPPRPRHAPLLDRVALLRVAIMAAAIVAATLGYYALLLGRGLPLAEARTGAFTLLAVCEWWNVLNCRSEEGSALGGPLWRNPWLLGGLLLSNLLQVLVVYWAPLAGLFGTVPLGLREVLEIAALGSLVLWAEEARKAFARRRGRRYAPAGGA